MVAKLIITPEEVRGLGNIVSEKSTDDFSNYKSSLALSTGVYTLSYNGNTVTLTLSGTTVGTGGTLTCTAVVTDENGDPIEDASVDFYYEVIE